MFVVLDGYAMNPGDLDWAPLRALGPGVIHERTPADAVVARAEGADAVFTNKVPLTAATFAALPALRYVGVMATGYNIVDVAAARAHGVTVTNVPAYGTASVAQHVFALILELAQHVGHHAAAVRAGRWSACPDFAFWERPLVELDGRVLGLVGFGRIGAAVARIGTAFGMRVLATTRTPRTVEGVDFVGLDELLERSDVVSLHCPLTIETQGLINAARLARMKPGAWLINTGRGPLVDEEALAAVLREGRLGGAGLDVLSVEPPPAGHPLLSAPNCLITPHHAWATQAARQRLLDTIVANYRAYLAGRPQNVV